jgi:hypothetical protein
MRCKSEQPFDKSSVFRILPCKYAIDSSLSRKSGLHHLSWENRTNVLNGWQFQSSYTFNILVHLLNHFPKFKAGLEE